MRYSRTIKLITFDAYNTLFKPKGSVSKQYVEEAAKFGISVTEDNISRHFERAYKAQIAKAPLYGIAQAMTIETWWKELIYNTFIGAGIQPKGKKLNSFATLLKPKRIFVELDYKFDGLFENINNRFATPEAYTIFPDVFDTLKQLKNDGYKLGVISNSDDRMATALKNLKLYDHFDFVLTSSMAGYEKPNRNIYEKALKLAGNINAENALHIGDDDNKDYFGAINAGWHAILLKRDDCLDFFTPAKVAEGVTLEHQPKEIASLSELDLLINKLNSVLPIIDKKVPCEEESRSNIV